MPSDFGLVAKPSAWPCRMQAILPPSANRYGVFESTMFQFFRRLIGRPRYVLVSFDWRVERDGVLLGTLREPRRIDMFWREVTFEPAPTAPAGIDWYDDRTWETGGYVIRHGELDLVAPHGILQAFGKPPFLNERGIPELVPEDEMDRAILRTST